MFATGIGYRLSGPVDALLALPKHGEQHRAIAPTEASLARLERLDHEAFGASRRPEHELYLSDAWGDDRGSGFTLERDGEAAGYGYAMRNGHIGPFAAHDPADQLALLRIAGDWLAARDIREAYGYFHAQHDRDGRACRGRLEDPRLVVLSHDRTVRVLRLVRPGQRPAALTPSRL
jgi:hypothetical protein